MSAPPYIFNFHSGGLPLKFDFCGKMSDGEYTDEDIVFEVQQDGETVAEYNFVELHRRLVPGSGVEP